MDIRLLNLVAGETHLFGSAFGREAYARLMSIVEENPTTDVFKIHLDGVAVACSVFVRESIAAVAKFYLGRRFLVIVNQDSHVSSNWICGVGAQGLTLPYQSPGSVQYIGTNISSSNVALLEFIRKHGETGSAVLAKQFSISTHSASTRLKSLATSGLLLRRESISLSGGKEFFYKSVVH